MYYDIQAVLESQHRLLDALLLEVLRDTTVDLELWAAFRATLRQHIDIEEGVLLAALRGAGVEFALAGRLHEDHTSIFESLVAEPTVAQVHELHTFLRDHEALEESDIGLFATCAQSLDEAVLVRAVRDFPGMVDGRLAASWRTTTKEDALRLVANKG